MIDADAHERVRRYVDGGAGAGHRAARPATTCPTAGWFVGPTIVAVDDPGAPVATEEIFGPVLAVLRAPRLRPRPRAGQRHRLRAHRRLLLPVTGAPAAGPPRSCGPATSTSTATSPAPWSGRQPFGGYGMSGIGSKAGGPDYLHQFLDPRVEHREHPPPGLRAGLGRGSVGRAAEPTASPVCTRQRAA